MIYASFKRLTVLSLLVLGLAFMPRSSVAQELSFADETALPVVDLIKIEGVQRLEEGTVTSYLPLSQGDFVSPDAVNKALKDLYATGLFEDVKIFFKDGTLFVQVKENPIVNQVIFEGNDAMSKEDLEKEIQLKPRFVYTLPRVRQDVQRLLDVYRRSGRFAAVVEPKLVELPQNRVDVVFEIVEGDRTGVRKISFIGNEQYDQSHLSSLITTEETAWWDFLASADFYDPDRMEYDKELLRRFYMNEGYIDFRVLSAVAELTPDRQDFFITFTLDEGSRYKFGEISLESEIEEVDAAALKKRILTISQEWYNAALVEKTITQLSDTLGDQQYAFVEISPEVTRHKDLRTVDLVYHIKEGKPVYIDRINITGNTRTLDKVIRRELLLAEGDPYSTTKIQRSEQRIKDLGFFKDARVTSSDAGYPDRAKLDVNVTEQSTGSVSFGAGFSSTDGPLGDFSIREQNFLGKGQDVRLGASVSGSTQQFDLSFTEPYFLNRDLTAGADIFHIIRDNQDESSYDETNTGFSLRMGYPLSEKLRQTLSYTLRRDEISNVPSTASRFIREQEGRSLTSMIGSKLTYDVRDSKVSPTTGFLSLLTTDFAGLGGERQFLRLKLLATKYFSLAEDYVLSATGEGGYIAGLGQDVRISDRFFLGGDTLRGFEFAGVGPRDETNGANDALGGNRFVRGALELSFPLPIPSEIGFKGHLFTEAGTVGSLDQKGLVGEIFEDKESLRASVGVGLTWSSPFGPLRLDLAYPFLKESYDKTQTIHFSFGTKF